MGRTLLLWCLLWPLQATAQAEETIAELVARDGRALLTTGNRVELLVDGPTAFARRLELLESARHHLLLSTFLWRDDRHGGELLDRICRLVQERRAEDGEFTALILVDAGTATGSGDHRRSVVRRLRRAGAEVRTFHPPTWGVANLFGARLHDKVMVVDGRRAIVGGRNLSDGYFDPVDSWFDADVLLDGPAVHELQMSFLKSWVVSGELGRPTRLLRPPERRLAAVRHLWATGRFPDGRSPLERFATPGFFPAPAAHPDGATVAVLVDNPLVWNRAPTVEVLLGLVRSARSAIDLTTPFPTLPPELLEALVEAVERGVRVRMVLPTTASTIRGGPFWRATLPSVVRLAQGGAELWGLRDTRADLDPELLAACDPRRMPPRSLHAKVVRVDREVTIVTASNFNVRSTYYNTEAGALIVDRGFARRVEQMFDELTSQKPVRVPCADADLELGAMVLDPPLRRIGPKELRAIESELGGQGRLLESLSPLW